MSSADKEMAAIHSELHRVEAESVNHLRQERAIADVAGEEISSLRAEVARQGAASLEAMTMSEAQANLWESRACTEIQQVRRANAHESARSANALADAVAEGIVTRGELDEVRYENRREAAVIAASGEVAARLVSELALERSTTSEMEQHANVEAERSCAAVAEVSTWLLELEGLRSANALLIQQGEAGKASARREAERRHEELERLEATRAEESQQAEISVSAVREEAHGYLKELERLWKVRAEEAWRNDVGLANARREEGELRTEVARTIAVCNEKMRMEQSIAMTACAERSMWHSEAQRNEFVITDVQEEVGALRQELALVRRSEKEAATSCADYSQLRAELDTARTTNALSARQAEIAMRVELGMLQEEFRRQQVAEEASHDEALISYKNNISVLADELRQQMDDGAEEMRRCQIATSSTEGVLQSLGGESRRYAAVVEEMQRSEAALEYVTLKLLKHREEAQQGELTLRSSQTEVRELKDQLCRQEARKAQQMQAGGNGLTS